MTLLVPNQSAVRMLKAIVNHTMPEDLVLKLFTNDDVTPHTEASGFGYAPITLSRRSWQFVEGEPSYAIHPEETFTFTGDLGNVYGYFIAQDLSGILMWTERFADGPYAIVNNGDKIRIVPRLELSPWP